MAGMIHLRTHPEPVAGCWACKVGAGPFVSASALTTRSGSAGVLASDAREKRWERDMPAYKSLRDDGLQPKAIDGAADLMARSETPEQIESGHPEWSPDTVRHFSEEFGHSVTTPAFGGDA